MEAAKSLRQPTNWQDFETLCKKLWGEIWNCPEIKKNGRNGQNQNGVDVYGIPAGELNYYGIQCKGKDEYLHKQFSEQEILVEIQKAKTFQPPLRKLYLATTAVKDSRTEEFVRKQNLTNVTAGLFEIHLFCWEDIVELIDENRQTHDWYAKNQNFRSTHSVAVNFDQGLNYLDVEPLFSEVTYLIEPARSYEDRYYETFGGGMIILSMPDSGKVMTNNSFIPFSLEIKNDGTQSIEKFQLIVSIVGDISRIATSNKESSPSSFARLAGIPSRENLDYEIDESKLQFRIIPRKEVLVGDDNYISDKIYIKPSPRQQSIELHWKLISKDFRTNGSLKIHSSPRFEEITKSVQEEDMPGEESPVIEDHLE